MLSFVIWSLFGALAGWHFGLRTQRDVPRQVRRNVIVGLVGGVLGGSVFHWTLAPNALSGESLLTAFVGAIALLAVGNLFPRPDSA
jgi:uncharacterized membrane protein YeaQ/YmgE (transglycosylase-associated protein family)